MSVNDCKVSKIKINVLIVDDEKDLTQLLQKIFEANGANVAVAHDGEEALAIYKNNPNYFDLILSDSLMPKMGGESLFEHVKNINGTKHPICLLISGGTLDFKSNLVNGFLEKPFSIRDIREKLLQFFPAEVS
jgi:CheY-like chemotaxis protein